MVSDELVLVYGTANEIDLALCRQVLEEAGIPVVEQKSVLEQLYVSVFREVQPFRLLVRAQDADNARAIVADYLRRVEAGEYALPEEDDD
ncbi:MAG TPA: DUF2007 domain-containing protein [Armatimonadota bacterium]|jgi:hypothetical protein